MTAKDEDRFAITSVSATDVGKGQLVVTNVSAMDVGSFLGAASATTVAYVAVEPKVWSIALEPCAEANGVGDCVLYICVWRFVLG